MERIFHLKENGTSVKTEILAGLTTFMTMAYIIALNPNLLTNFAVGTPLWNGVFLATCIASAIGTVVMAFLATAVYFGLMAVYGTTTHKDLTGWGPRLMMALVAMIVTSLVGALFGFGFGTSVLYCGIGLVVFMLLTAYDTQKLRQIYAYYAGDAELAEKASIYGALTLYLDFINIFLYVVRLLGMNSRSRNN